MFAATLKCSWTQGAPPPASAEGQVVVLQIVGRVEVQRAGTQTWLPASTNLVLQAADRLRTLEHSHAVLKVPSLSAFRLGQLSILEMPTPQRSSFGFLRGILYYFHRDRPGSLPIQTPTVAALIRGTEFNVVVDPTDGTTILSLLDGEVEVTGPRDTRTLLGGEEVIASPGQPLQKSPILDAVRIVQWTLYYPAVIDPNELELPPAEVNALDASLGAYRAGEVLAALESYPAGRTPASDPERVYRAGLLLSVGQVEEAERVLGAMSPATARAGPPARLAGALRQLMAAAKGQVWPTARPPELASEWLAESYYRQSQYDLEGALRAARNALARSPDFGFAWARVAELEFSFGRLKPMANALQQAVRLAPRHAQALALQGFVHAAENRLSQAIESFNRAIAVDPNLGNAWLGRGLCQIRQNQTEAGLQDLEVAVVLEPRRAVLRSYLGKAFSHANDPVRAGHELDLAKQLDPNDPTAWLYSALLNQQQNQINSAVRDLEHSQRLNNNRRVYRSRILLDQDRAVRGANLASVLLDAGLVELSTREATRAVNTDYANFSAHLFLANSYNALRDPRQVNLRYETPWLSEYLVANLLAPAGAGTLSPIVTQQEYSKLLERNRLFGVASITEYASRGDWLQAGALYGNYKNSSWAAEATYRSLNGDWPNNELEDLTATFRFKQDVTPNDSFYVQAIYYDAEGGDLAQHYARSMVNHTLEVEESQEPILLAGYHHQWTPGSHTLALVGRLDDTTEIFNGQHQTLLVDRSLPGPPPVDDVIAPVFVDQRWRSELEIYTAEIQQLYQQGDHTFIAGARAQAGEFETQAVQDDFRAPTIPGVPLAITGSQDVSPQFTRLTGYGYYYWQAAPPLTLIAGVSYDWIEFPINHVYGPITGDEDTTDRVSPKAGMIWTPWRNTTLRGGYTRSLGGVSFEQSFRLEPTQVAGFNQAFRSLVPESEAGSSPAATFETAGISLEQRFGRGTYVGLYGEWLVSEANRTIGVFEFTPQIQEASARERLDYRERSAGAYAYQLLGDRWSLGALYRFTTADLDRHLRLPPSIDLDPDRDLESSLHQVNLFAIYNHPCGFFGQLNSLWMHQSNHGYNPERPGDEFWQFDVWMGYRLAQRRVEARVGVLNVTDQDYRLNPLNLTPRLPRERTFAASLKFIF